MPPSTVPTLCLASLLALTGCPDREVSAVEPAQDLVEIKELPVNPNRALDLLFVIDNSNSMQANQDNLKANFNSFIAALATVPDGNGGTALPDLHIGVVTSDVGAGTRGPSDEGELQTTRHDPDGPDAGTAEDVSDCGMLHAAFLQDVADANAPGGRGRNFDGELADAFACIASVGTEGSGLEAHLESARQALEKASTGAGNQGFLRADAYLAIVIIADEDDCSPPPGDDDPALWDANAGLGKLQSFRCFEYGVTCTQDVRPIETTQGPDPAIEVTGCLPNGDASIVPDIETYVDYFKGLKPNPRDVIVATIIGDTDHVTIGQVGGTGDDKDWFALMPSCGVPGTAISARPGIRLDGFRRQFPGRNFGSSICQEQLDQSLRELAAIIGDVIGNPCLHNLPLDANADLPGVQADCAVSYRIDEGAPMTMPQCSDPVGETPCWRIVEDTMSCPEPTADHLALELVWEDGVGPLDAVVDAQCATVAPPA